MPYSILRVCERFKMLGPGVKIKFEDNTPVMQQTLLAYESIRQQEELEELEFLAQCLGAKPNA